MSRGNREGNNALVKDTQMNTHYPQLELSSLLKLNIPIKTLEQCFKLDICDKADIENEAYIAVQYGNLELAAHLIEKDMKKNNVGFTLTLYHVESALITFLTDWLSIQSLSPGGSDIHR